MLNQTSLIKITKMDGLVWQHVGRLLNAKSGLYDLT